ncbi:MAG: alkaline phosphatase family protein [Chloroflexi bacterium]|nr:alkaline phosphatase family protein [Chloroflexota bacterium]MCL5110679.1 alkaline phosphatase family protein [Chloroflexota bacterium]
MAKTAKKVMVLGLDGPIAPRVYNWAKQGELPTIGRLIEEGVHASNCLVPFPTITPPNWASIATGAWPGTHGITDFDGHVPGDPLDKVHQNFDSGFVLAETLWEAGERVGKRSILVNWPTTWPPTIKDGAQVGGAGLSTTDWRLGIAHEIGFTTTILSGDMLLSTEMYPHSHDVTLRKARGWEGVEHSAKALEAEVPLRPWRPKTPLKPVTWHLLVDCSGDDGYDVVTVARTKDRQGVYARLRVGEWSQSVVDTFDTDEGPQQALFRMKLLELSGDAQRFRLYVPGLFALHGWGYPASIEDEISSEGGLPISRTGWEPFLMEWIDMQTLVETNALEHEWIADATKILLAKPWDMYFLQLHTPDYAYHTFSADIDPLTAADEATVLAYQDLELQLYKSVDRALGRILEAAGEDTLVVVTSDHGGKAKTHAFHIEDILKSAGLLVYSSTGEGEEHPKVDWTRTKAVSQRFVHIYVNTKGRDPDGIVEPGEEYEQVREQVIKALHEYVDPKTGLKPIVLALKREDARILGHYTERSGDVIYAIDPHFYNEHGPYLPTTRFGVGDMRGLFVMAGPGVKRGELIERTVWLTDIVPTICHLAEMPVPKHCEGGIIYQALADPDAQVKELQALRRNVDRLKRMVERPPMC